MGHFAHASFQNRPQSGCVQWRGQKSACAADWNDQCDNLDKEVRREIASADPTPGLLVLALVATILSFLILPSDWGDGVDSPSRITSEAVDASTFPAPALRGCCGDPTEFRWLLDSSDKAVAGQPFRTVLLARDSRGRQARPASCGALRVGVDLSGKAHLSGASLPLAWRLSQLEFHIESELAEVVEAEVRIESPDPQAEVLLHTSRIHFSSGPMHSLSLQVQTLDGKRPAAGWPLHQELAVVVSTKDQFGNPTSLNRSSSGLVLRTSAQRSALDMRPRSGALDFGAHGSHGSGRAFLTALRPGVVEIWVEQVGDKSPQQLKAATLQSLSFEQENIGAKSPSDYLAAFRSKASPSDLRWQAKADEVREAFLHAWRGYERFAWGADELQPISKVGRNSFGGLGLTILDSLSTLWLMGLDKEFDKGVKFVRDELDFDRADSDVSVFELTIRGLGGLLGAHTLSGNEILLERAQELGARLLPAFKTSSRLPWPTVNLLKGTCKVSTQPVILSEAGSIQVEFRSLSARTGDSRFQEAADKTFQAVQSTGMRGILPVFLSPPSMVPVQGVASKFAFGALADSYYEYHLKQWLQNPAETRFKEHFLDVMDALPSMVRPSPLAKKAEGRDVHYKLVELAADGSLVWKMDHLSCFAPGLIALGLMELPEQDLAKNDRNKTWWRLAEGLTSSCFELWSSSASKLAPEFARVNSKPPHDFVEAPSEGRHSFLRPETAESLFYLYRLTGDEKYRRWGLTLFQAILDHAKVPHGFASVRDVKAIPTSKMDEMQTFLMAETFKYLFLLFSPAAALDLNRFFLNTEGHPLKRRAKRSAQYPLEGISSAPAPVVTHVRSLTMSSLRGPRVQDPRDAGGNTGREATLRSVRSELRSAAQFCAKHTMDLASGRVKPRPMSGADTPRASQIVSPTDSPEKQEARSPDREKSQASIQSTSVLNTAKALRGTRDVRLRCGRLFQRDAPRESPPFAPLARVPQSSTSPRVTAASPGRKPSAASLVVQLRPRSGSFSQASASSAAGAVSPGAKAALRQTSAGAKTGAVRKRSGPCVPVADSPMPMVEEEFVGLTGQVITAGFDETNTVICFENPEVFDSERHPLRMQIWWRGGWPSVTVRGLHEQPITCLALCHGTRPSEALSNSDSSGSVGSDPQWLVTSSRDRTFAWRLDRLSKVVAEAMHSQEVGEEDEYVELVSPTGVLQLPKRSVEKCYVEVWEYEGPREVPPLGLVQCRPAPRGSLVVASTHDSQVVIHAVTRHLEVLMLQRIGWSDPLSEIVVTDIPPKVPDARMSFSKDRVMVWFAGIGAKLYSLEVSVKEKELPRRLVAHVNLLPNNPVSCLACSAVAESRCYVGCKMAMVQIMEWVDPKSFKSSHLGKVQIPGEDATVLAMRSIRGEEEVLAILLENKTVYLQGLLNEADDKVVQSGAPVLAVSLASIPSSLPTLTAMFGGPKSPAACAGSLHLGWLAEDSNTFQIAAVPLKSERKPKPMNSIKAEARRPSLSTQERLDRSPMTTPRGGNLRRKPLNGAGASGLTRPASSRGVTSSLVPDVDGRKDSRRMVSGPSATRSAGKPVARPLKRNPRLPNKAASVDVVEELAVSESEAHARVPSPGATERHRSLEATRTPARPSARCQEDVTVMVEREERWQSGAHVAIQPQQTWAPGGTGASTPQMWRIGATASRGPRPMPHAPSPQGQISQSQSAIQGLSSWPTVWIPQAVPASSLTRHSMGQTLMQTPVSASPAVIHRLPGGPQAYLGRWPVPPF
ncbi:unnamed protein product [Effrenium voratum]|nr:unnamed protein product [Effrenium voratum]